MVLGALEAKTVWTKSKARLFQIFDLQSSIIFKAKNNMDKSPWGLDKVVFGLVFAVVLSDIFKFICYENNNENNADAAGSGRYGNFHLV